MSRSKALPTRAYLHPTLDRLVHTDEHVYQSGRELVLREDIDDLLAQVTLMLTEALRDVENIANAEPLKHADHPTLNEGCRANFERGHHEKRAYTLKDAKPRARVAAAKLREVWDLVDPPMRPGA